MLGLGVLTLVHTNGNRLAAIAVLLAEGEAENPAYQPFIANLPAEEIAPTPTGDGIDGAAALAARHADHLPLQRLL